MAGQLAGRAYATDITWNGLHNNSWAQGNNWNGNAVPGTGDTADFDASASPPRVLINLNANQSVYALEFKGSTSFELAGGTSGGTHSLTLGSGSLTATGSVTPTTFTLDSTVNLPMVINNSWEVDKASTVVVDGVISDGGSGYSLTKNGTGTLILGGANTYSGGTTIGGGTLIVGDGTTNGSITGNVTDNGTLEFNRSDNITFGGTISGSGSLMQAGAGTLTLTGGTSGSPSSLSNMLVV
ncbi:MAG TPA: autotransporter-associated beta strand repeat-containing protein, partial [Tepidisphaeraceae bacterium]|nr:autotransporter-associated beta strand repeat-containing protein [Tepidisphaeraceae bacterium]